MRGAVQGVGFRPFVYGVATRLGLAGFVLNGPEGVEVEVEGAEADVEGFVQELETSPPRLARIDEVQTDELEPVGDTEFVIRHSAQDGERTVFIAPDMATCADCLRELASPADRRYRYPFVNCTNCGPRYTIICDVPYDRAKTTMASFEMCRACRAEYEDPSNRRFHAEPTCCPACGPKVWLADAAGDTIISEDAVNETIRRLAAGDVVAVRAMAWRRGTTLPRVMGAGLLTAPVRVLR